MGIDVDGQSGGEPVTYDQWRAKLTASRHARSHYPQNAHNASSEDSEHSEVGQWGAPEALQVGHCDTEFPVEVLPSWLGDYVSSLSESTQVDAGFVGQMCLAVVSTAAGGRVVVEVVPDWREPVNLYLVSALESGNRKSAVVAHSNRPLLACERQTAELMRDKIVEAEARKRSADQAARRAADDASKSLDPDAMNEAIAKAQLAEAIDVPTTPRLLADDATPEALGSLLAEQGGRIAALSAEGELLSIVAGRYSQGIPQLGVLLKGHSGDELRVDRRGRDPEYVAHPAITLGLGVQPVVLADLARVDGARERGLLARILYSLPPSWLGRRKISPQPVPTGVASAYDTNVVTLVETLAGWEDPAVVVLSDDALQTVRVLMAELEPQLGPGGDMHHVADWAGKLAGHAVRLAGLLHVADAPATAWTQPISGDTMRRAITLARYYIDHALIAFGLMGADPVIADARVVLAWLYRKSPPKFTKRDAQQPNKGRFAKAADIDPALRMLVELGWIRPLPAEERTGPGRPASPRYETHPAIHQ